MALRQILDEVQAAGAEKHLLVVAEPVKVVKDRIGARLGEVVAWRQEGAVADLAPQNTAGHREAFGAPSGPGAKGKPRR